MQINIRIVKTVCKILLQCSIVLVWAVILWNTNEQCSSLLSDCTAYNWLIAMVFTLLVSNNWIILNAFFFSEYIE